VTRLYISSNTLKWSEKIDGWGALFLQDTRIVFHNPESMLEWQQSVLMSGIDGGRQLFRGYGDLQFKGTQDDDSPFCKHCFDDPTSSLQNARFAECPAVGTSDQALKKTLL
jgi:hypothetical protein